MAHRHVENYHGYWLHSERQDHTLTATADENWCHYCHQYEWITNILERKVVMDDKGVIKIITTHLACCPACHKTSAMFCQPQHCPFTNIKRTETLQICTACSDILRKNTQNLLT